MKKIASILLALTVLAGSITVPQKAEAAAAYKAGGCALRIASSGLKVTSEKPDTPASGASIVYQDTTYSFRVRIRNAGKTTVKKAVVKGEVGDKSFTFRTGSLSSGKSTTKKKSFSSEDSELAGKKFRMLEATVYYAGGVKEVHDFSTSDHYTPTFSGFVKSGSYENCEGEIVPYMTVYKGQANSYNYKKYVSAKDNKDKKPKITVDKSKVNFSKKGTYTIYYTAKDNNGNSLTVPAKIAVRLEGDSLDRFAQSVLSRITKSSWSDERKARAIANYTHGRVRWTGGHGSYNWESEAYRGLDYGIGDCVTYYAVNRALLTRAGIPNAKVKLINVPGRHHLWNMAYVRGGFYHIDSCPRTRHRGTFMLLTDGQLSYYASHVESRSHVWNRNTTPKSGTRVISRL